MNNELTGLTDDQLRTLLNSCREMLRAVAQSLGDRPDLSEAVRQLMLAPDMLEAFQGTSESSPEHSRLVLQAAIAALVNVQSWEAVEAEQKRRAMNGN